ncbi:hypothetical protein PC110_g4551 [Phytophthora cactorum]|uniref:Crinkler effector protein N-terminal domain-containing protein n=1 Tax=Phytophthora cactorum TaxID=29920 RepID=A0A329SRQ8_9STRA|nr:hypothetical protein PC112_g1993 [Phytophthora cactorum]KAG2927709.1 hypothetical protein PC114_g3403 [Phytophthora cactorum]KAG2942308.1 hypothetical protein PC115_g1532 [Phytophthora cactorum]KAG2953098.1 hypothetical protein PC117_g2300 [Phytophthora cactorum]KAG3034760.1 hypothetical protein PC120_g1238 [Phytophthora cactorum]
MVKLSCAFVGTAGSTFPVDIDASLSVGGLKDATKAKQANKLKNVDAKNLQLYLAKEGNVWVTEAEVKNDDEKENMLETK